MFSTTEYGLKSNAIKLAMDLVIRFALSGFSWSCATACLIVLLLASATGHCFSPRCFLKLIVLSKYLSWVPHTIQTVYVLTRTYVFIAHACTAENQQVLSVALCSWRTESCRGRTNFSFNILMINLPASRHHHSRENWTHQRIRNFPHLWKQGAMLHNEKHTMLLIYRKGIFAALSAPTCN